MTSKESPLELLQRTLKNLQGRAQRNWLYRALHPVPDRQLAELSQILIIHLQECGTVQSEHRRLMAAYEERLVRNEERIADLAQAKAKLRELAGQVGALAAHGSSVLQELQQHAAAHASLQQEQKLTVELVRKETSRLSVALEDLATQATKFLATQEPPTAISGTLVSEQVSPRAQLAEDLDPTKLVLERLAEQQKTLLAAQGTQEQKTATLGGDVTRAHEQLALLLRDRGRDHPEDFASFYLAFEDKFRGSQQEITARLQEYIPHVRAALQQTRGKSWVDLGCGRGEWLEIVQAQDAVAVGVDDNLAMLEACRARGLTVYSGDALEFLDRQEPQSLAGVSAFHLIEHLPYRTMLSLFRVAYRVIAPGGYLIIETPNPQNVSVGACNFYLDVTHQKPIPPPTAQFIAEYAGFKPVTVRMLHPYARHAERDRLRTVTDREYCEMFYGPQDYAIIAVRQ